MNKLVTYLEIYSFIHLVRHLVNRSDS